MSQHKFSMASGPQARGATVTTALALGLAVVLLALSWRGLAAEARTYSLAFGWDSTRYFGLDGQPTNVRSVARDPDIASCIENAKLAGLRADPAGGEAVGEAVGEAWARCEAIIDDKLAQSPLWGDAQLWKAIARHSREGWSAAAQEAFAASARLAPYEGWVLQARFRLVADDRASLPAAMLELVERDVMTMADGIGSAQLLASYYVNGADTDRAWVDDVLAGVPDARSERFREQVAVIVHQNWLKEQARNAAQNS